MSSVTEGTRYGAAGRLCFLVTSHITAVTFMDGYLAHLRAQGFDVTLLCSPGPGVERLAREQGVAYVPVAMRRDPSPLADLHALVTLARVLRRLKPEVLVYATPKASLLGAVAGAVVGVPTRVYELWGLRLETATGIALRVFTALERLTIRLSTAVVANSRSLADRVTELRLIGRRSADVLGAGSSHGVDTDRFSPGSLFPALDGASRDFLDTTAGLVVGFIGRIHPDKGVDTLIAALAICAERGVGVRGILVGGDEGAQLETNLALSSRVPPVHRVGQVDDPRAYLAAIDVLVLMSLREGFPNVVLEAAAMGRPAVVAASTGTRDSVVDKITGYVVPVGDAVSLADRLCDLANDESLRLRLGAAARARVVKSYSQPAVWQMHADYFARANARVRRSRSRKDGAWR